MAAIGRYTVRRRGAIPIAGIINNYAFTIAQGGSSNICLVTMTPQNTKGTTVSGLKQFIWYLSDDSGGAGITGTAASGAVAANSGGGTDLVVLTAKKVTLSVGVAAGTFQASITDSGKTGFYVCVINPWNGVVAVSRQLVAGDYK